MQGKRYDALTKYIYDNVTEAKVSNMKTKWKLENSPDKRLVEVKCPICGNIEHPLLKPDTIEVDYIKRRSRADFKVRISTITYGTECNKCNNKYKFKVICNTWHYSKLGLY